MRRLTNKKKKEEEEDEDSIHVHRYTMKNTIQTHTHEVTLHTGNSFATDALLQTPAMTATKISAPAAGCDTCCQLMAHPMAPTVHNIAVYAAHFSPRCTDGCGNAHHTLCSGTRC